VVDWAERCDRAWHLAQLSTWTTSPWMFLEALLID
jgi:hypothetical protein